MCPCCWPRCWRRSPCGPAGAISTAPSAPAATRSAILDAAPDAALLALDRDPSAIAGGADLVAAMAGRLTLSQACFGELAEEAERFGMTPLDGVVLDIGVSSMQIDQAERGFSFRFDGPLDMRMSAAGQSAADLVNEAEEGLLADIFYHYGEERRSPRRGPRRRSRRARKAADGDDEAARRPRRRGRAGASRAAASIRRRASSRRCASRSMTSSANWCGRCMRPKPC